MPRPQLVRATPERREELTAAAVYDFTKVPTDFALMRDAMVTTRARSIEPRKWFECISEIEFGINRGAKIAGYAHITARKLNPDGTPGDVVTTGQQGALAELLASPYGGQRALIERYFQYLKVEGDSYLVRCRDGKDVVGYDIVGADELETESLDGLDTRGMPTMDRPLRRIVMPGQAAGSDNHIVEIQPRDMLGRIWRPSLKYVQVASSPLKALNTECRTLHLLTLGLIGKLTSRLALNGILIIPTEANDIRTAQPRGKGEPVQDNSVMSTVINAATWAIANLEDPTSALPIFASVPAQYVEAFRHLVLDREVYDTDMKLRAEAIDRILTGLDVQKQQTKGEGDTTRFTQWNGADDEMKIQVKPDLDTFMWALTRLVMNREMLDSGKSEKAADRYCFWYDLDRAQTVVSQAEDARQASDRILISDPAARKAMNFGEETAPSGDEYVRQLGRKINNPYLALLGTPEFDKIDWDMVAKVGSSKNGPNEASPGDKPESSPGNAPTKAPGVKQKAA